MLNVLISILSFSATGSDINESDLLHALLIVSVDIFFLDTIKLVEVTQKWICDIEMGISLQVHLYERGVT